MTKEQYSIGTFLTMVILHSVDPGSAAREVPCLPPPGNAAAGQRMHSSTACTACTAPLPHNHSGREHRKDLLQPTLRRAAQPSKHLAGFSSHSKVTTGWKAWFGIESNFKHVQRHVEIMSRNIGGKAFCSYEKCLGTFMATKTLATSQQPCDSSPLGQEGFAGLLLNSDSKGAFQHCL